ncbi:MAG: glycosyltransferase family 4 protein [Rubrobacteraceae bacterium]
MGFACDWGKVPEESWSGTPWGLRAALGRRTGVTDLGVGYSASRDFWKYAYARRRYGKWISAYQWSSSWDRAVRRKLRASLGEASVDAVVEVGDLARLDVPFYVYQDLSFDVLERYFDPEVGIPGFKGIDLETIKRRRERQREIYEAATGIFAMSEWFADTLVDWSGIPPEKVAVVYAGLNSIETQEVPGSETSDPPSPGSSKLLFVGRDFFRKGGDIVVAALKLLRGEYSPDVELTVAGPAAWPLPGGVPEGVVFLGDRPTAEVARLYREHDLFVMPSRFEAFGIVFREALANGLPVIGRSAFALPEIITPGKNGALVDDDDPEELARAVVAVLENPEIRRFTIRAAKDVRERFSWDAVAGRMLEVISRPSFASSRIET